MEILKLRIGEHAPADTDSIRIQRTGDGRHQLTGSALLACGDGENAESVSIVGGETYETYEEAEAAGLAWGAGHCVEQLYIERAR